MTNQNQETPDSRWRLSNTTMIVLAAACVVIGAAAWMYYSPAASAPPKAPVAAGEDAAKVLEEAAQLMQPLEDPQKEIANCAEAARKMMAYVKSQPGDVLVRPLLAQALWQLEQYPAAETTCDELFKRGRIDAKLLMIKGICARQRTKRSPMSIFEKALKAPGVDAEVQSEYAVEALVAGDAAQKAQVPALLDEALAEGTLRTEKWVDFAYRLAQAKEPKAYAYFQKGLEAGAKRPVLVARIGLALMQGGQEAWGRKYVSAARQAGLNSPDFLLAWGRLELKANNLEHGREMLTESLKVKPDQRECYDLLARSMTGPDALVQAEGLLVRGVAACGKPADQAWLLVRLGENRERQQNYRDAAEAYQTATNAAEQKLVGAKGAARCYLKLARIDDAARWAEMAAGVDAGDPEVKQIKAQIDQARGGQK